MNILYLPPLQALVASWEGHNTLQLRGLVVDNMSYCIVVLSERANNINLKVYFQSK
jgi:hypothetical protein